MTSLRLFVCASLFLSVSAWAAPAPKPGPKAKAARRVPVPAKQVKKRLCVDRKPCKVEESSPAGKGASGEDLTVHRIELGKDEEAGCDRVEYWLLSSQAGKPVSTQKLVDICNDGYGAAGIGEDAVEVKDNLFAHSRNGGSSWRWSNTTVLQLSPLRVKSEYDDSDWVNGSTTDESTWSWDDFRGETRWFVPACREDGSYDDDAEGEDDAASDGPYVYAPIPVVQAPADFAAAGWADAGLGRCALDVDGSTDHGYTTFGKPSAAPRADSRFRVVMPDAGTLVVEVHDDTWVGPSASWVKDDHLELWLSRDDDQPEGEQCLQQPGPTPEQWGIRIADGQVFAAAGKPKATLAVTRRQVTGADGKPVVRMKIQLPPGRGRVTLVYSDSDDGKKQERLIATSQLSFGKGVTLGSRIVIKPEDAICELVNGQLEPRQVRTFRPESAAVSE